MPAPSRLLAPLLLLLPAVHHAAAWDTTTSVRVGSVPAADDAAPPPSTCSDASKIESHPGMMWSGEPTWRDVFAAPSEPLEFGQCCELSQGVVRSTKFSLLKFKDHSARHPDQPAYLCAAYGDDARLVKANSSIKAGRSSGLPPAPPGPAKPNCNFATAQECIAGGGAKNCFWYDDSCSYRTPAELNCLVDIDTMPYHPANICMSMAVLDSNPFASDPSKLLRGPGPVLGKFNWSSGQLSQYTEVTKYPPQIVSSDGEVHWWSVSSGLVVNSSGSFITGPFDAVVTYEEIVNGQETHATGFSYSVSGKADYGIDLSGPGFSGKVTGKEIGVNSHFALGFNLVFWPNVTAAAAVVEY